MSAVRDASWAWAAPAVLVGALVARAAWVLWDGARAGPALTFDDETLHWQLASHLLEHGRLVADDGRLAARMPLYPLLLAPFTAWGERGVLAARLAQSVAGAATAWAACRFAWQAAGRRAGLTAGLLVAMDPYSVFFTGLLLNETVYALVLVCLSWAAWLALRDRRAAPGVAEGGREGRLGAGFWAILVLGPLATLLRPEALAYVLLLWLVLLFARTTWRVRLTRTALWGAALLLALAPWAARNRVVLGHTVWLSTNGGVTLYDGQGPQADGSSDQSFLRDMPELAALDEAQRDRQLFRAAVQQMRSDPGRVARLAIEKLRRTWSLAPNLPPYRDSHLGRVAGGFTVAVLALAVVGTWRLRRDTALLLGLWLAVMFTTLLSAVLIGSVRYRVPLMPLVEVAAGLALARATQRAEPSRAHEPAPSPRRAR
jgi:4-amino-4-deoxy-L-arabinose transferase-like glycosyltransferase